MTCTIQVCEYQSEHENNSPAPGACHTDKTVVQSFNPSEPLGNKNIWYKVGTLRNTSAAFIHHVLVLISLCDEC